MEEKKTIEKENEERKERSESVNEIFYR